MFRPAYFAAVACGFGFITIHAVRPEIIEQIHTMDETDTGEQEQSADGSSWAGAYKVKMPFGHEEIVNITCDGKIEEKPGKMMSLQTKDAKKRCPGVSGAVLFMEAEGEVQCWIARGNDLVMQVVEDGKVVFESEWILTKATCGRVVELPKPPAPKSVEERRAEASRRAGKYEVELPFFMKMFLKEAFGGGGKLTADVVRFSCDNKFTDKDGKTVPLEFDNAPEKCKISEVIAYVPGETTREILCFLASGDDLEMVPVGSEHGTTLGFVRKNKESCHKKGDDGDTKDEGGDKKPEKPAEKDVCDSCNATIHRGSCEDSACSGCSVCKAKKPVGGGDKKPKKPVEKDLCDSCNADADRGSCEKSACSGCSACKAKKPVEGGDKKPVEKPAKKPVEKVPWHEPKAPWFDWKAPWEKKPEEAACSEEKCILNRRVDWSKKCGWTGCKGCEICRHSRMKASASDEATEMPDFWSGVGSVRPLLAVVAPGVFASFAAAMF